MPITISTDTLWNSQVPIVLTEHVEIGNGATLTIAEGTSVEGDFHNIVVVDGALRAEGSAAAGVTFRDTNIVGDDVFLEWIDMDRGALLVGGDGLHISESTFRHVSDTLPGYSSGVRLTGDAEVTGSVFIHAMPLQVLGDNVTVEDNWFLFQEGLQFRVIGSAEGMTIVNNSFATGPRAYAYRDLLFASDQGTIEVTGTYLYGVDPIDYDERIFDDSRFSGLSWEIVDQDPWLAPKAPPVTIHDSGTELYISEDDTSLIGPDLVPGYTYSVNEGALQVEEGSWLYFELSLPQPDVTVSGGGGLTESRTYAYDVDVSLDPLGSTVEAIDVEHLSRSTVNGIAFRPAVDLDSEPTEIAYLDLALSGEYFGDAPESYRIKVEVLDKAVATEFSDFLVGNVLSNDIAALGGDDTIVGGPGDDTINGGSGVDMASFEGSQTSYTLSLSPTETTIADRRSDGTGTDLLREVELVDFATEIPILDGMPLDLRVFGGLAEIDPAQLESFVELYIAYFNRAPDAIGLNFWGTAFANGTSLEEMAALFGPQPETQQTFPPDATNADFAVAVYNNVLGRTPDQAGIDFWVGQLDADAVSRDQFILEVLRGAKSALKPELGQDFVDQQLADRAYLESKIDIGAYFAVIKGMSDVADASAAMALYDGTVAGISAAVDAIDGYHAAALDPMDGEFLMPLVGVLDDPFVV